MKPFQNSLSYFDLFTETSLASNIKGLKFLFSASLFFTTMLLRPNKQDAETASVFQ